MNREDMVNAVASVLISHDCAEYSSHCICGKKLYYTGVEGTSAMTMCRHRAESIVDTLHL